MEYVIWMPTPKPTDLSGNKQILNSAARPYDEWAFSPLVCTADWLWRYPCLQLLIFMLWPRQAIFESKEAKFSSSGECRIISWEVWNTKSPADWMPTHKPTELPMIKQKHELNSPSLWWVRIQPTLLHCRLAFASVSGDICLWWYTYLLLIVSHSTPPIH